MTNLEHETFVILVDPYYAALERQAELRDNDVITDKILQAMQKSLLRDANATILKRIKQEDYRRKWAFKDEKRQDKRDHKAEVKAEKLAFKAQLRAQTDERRRQAKERRAARWAAFKARFRGKG